MGCFDDVIIERDRVLLEICAKTSQISTLSLEVEAMSKKFLEDYHLYVWDDVDKSETNNSSSP